MLTIDISSIAGGSVISYLYTTSIWASIAFVWMCWNRRVYAYPFLPLMLFVFYKSALFIHFLMNNFRGQVMLFVSLLVMYLGQPLKYITLRIQRLTPLLSNSLLSWVVSKSARFQYFNYLSHQVIYADWLFFWFWIREIYIACQSWLAI